MIDDWLFSDENRICNFRVAGVLIKNNSILLQKEKNGKEYAVPGGHVRAGETTEQSLIREYLEETGVDIICNRLCWVEETFWEWGDKNAHTITFYYLISLENDSELSVKASFPQKDNDNVVLEWVPLENIETIMVYPQFLKEKATNISPFVEHFISKDEKTT